METALIIVVYLCGMYSGWCLKGISDLNYGTILKFSWVNRICSSLFRKKQKNKEDAPKIAAKKDNVEYNQLGLKVIKGFAE